MIPLIAIVCLAPAPKVETYRVEPYIDAAPLRPGEIVIFTTHRVLYGKDARLAKRSQFRVMYHEEENRRWLLGDFAVCVARAGHEAIAEKYSIRTFELAETFALEMSK